MPSRQTNFAGYILKWRSIPPSELAAMIKNPRWQAWSADVHFTALVESLLSIAGELVVPPTAMPPHKGVQKDISMTLSKGQFYPGMPVCLMPGQPSKCHGNVSRLWQEGLPIWIATGYALSKDGRWRSHTWGVARQRMPCGDLDTIDAGDVVETTESRVAYFGYLLNEHQASRFAKANA